MRPETIFIPVGVLALWTMAVSLLIGVRRVLAGRAGRLPPGAFRVGEAPGVPEDVLVVNRNHMNLLEAPVLFYIVALALFVTHRVTERDLVLAWGYLGLRLMHSVVHLTTNRVFHRLLAFGLSNVVLVSMWVHFLRSMR